jgi:CubicO group peptidase (beta-lactamase class C family)
VDANTLFMAASNTKGMTTLLWSRFTRRSGLATMKPTSKFGEVIEYSNLMATAAGYVGAA